MQGAHDGIRTRDLFLTKEVLCRLSYVSPVPGPDPPDPNNKTEPSCAALPPRKIGNKMERATRLELATLSLEG